MRIRIRTVNEFSIIIFSFRAKFGHNFGIYFSDLVQNFDQWILVSFTTMSLLISSPIQVTRALHPLETSHTTLNLL